MIFIQDRILDTIVFKFISRIIYKSKNCELKSNSNKKIKKTGDN